MAKKDGFNQKRYDNYRMKYLQNKILYNIFFTVSFIGISMSQDWQFNPDSLRDDGPIIPMIINPLIDGYVPEIDYSKDEKSDKYNGFRIQVLSTRSAKGAENMRLKMASQVNHSVRVIFEAPNYKVRVGSFTVRKEADRLRKYLFSLGYTTAWVIRARINY